MAVPYLMRHDVGHISWWRVVLDDSFKVARKMNEFLSHGIKINNPTNDLSNTMRDKVNFGKWILLSISFILLLIVVGIIIFYSIYVYSVIPISFSTIAKVAVSLVLGYFIITFLGKEIRQVSLKLFGERRSNMILVVYRFASYIVLALVILAIIGISGTALLAGGTFAGLVLGLAGQTVLSNIISGVMIILARPYEVGDRITLVTWQYGLIAPAYPPKFYSHDTLMPGYSGRVLDIGLAYTLLVLDDGTTMKIPNSVMVVAAIVSHELQERWVRTKYEIPGTIDPEKVLSELQLTISKNLWVSKPDTIAVLVNSANSSSYVISIDVVCKGNLEEPPRSSILLDVMGVVKRLGAKVDPKENTVNQPSVEKNFVKSNGDFQK
jgi:small conductance mechanosensitive channel